MKASQAWHQSPFGVISRWLGSVQLAVPVLVFVAVALAWGTYLESTQNAKVAKALVYGSWWFIVLMALVCLSLVFAVVTRFPWRRRHIGFITVHASLLLLIAGGFWSLFGRIEGRLMLRQGTQGAEIETDEEQLQLVEFNAGHMNVLGAVPTPRTPGQVTIGGVSVRIVERWDNVHEDIDVVDGGPEPFRAVELSLDPSPKHGTWIGDEARGGPWRSAGMTIRVMAAGADYKPPPQGGAPGGQAEYRFVVGGQNFPVTAEGQQAFPGWTVTSIKRFDRAIVAADGVVEGTSGDANPAVSVTISDGKGNSERHAAYQKFPDMVLSKVIEGTATSGARLTASGQPDADETLVIYGRPSAVRVAYVARDGAVTILEHDGPLPWTFQAGSRQATILNDFAAAHEVSRFTRAPSATEHRPALVVADASGPGSPPATLAWKAVIPFAIPGRNAALRYGPRTVPLSFSIRLDQFRKLDYPGTDMAMAYESDVTVLAIGSPDEQFKIFMNNPLAKAGWRVYQSGFVGEDISIFSVMKDPGLTLTYASSTSLCIGILIVFYARGLSGGHPGIPGLFARKEDRDGTLPARSGSLVSAAPIGVAGGPALGALDGPAGGDGDPGRGAGDAPGHLRPQPGGAAHRA